MRRIDRDKSYVYTTGAADLLYALQDEKQFLKLLADNGKSYKPLLKYLSVHEWDHNVKGSLKLKTMAADLNITQAKLNKQLLEVYTDIWELNDKHSELFNFCNGDEFCFLFSHSYKGYYAFTLWLRQPIQAGGRFSFPFLAGKFGIHNMFIIENMSYEYLNGRLVTEVFCKENYNTSV
ncbi:hypothetical protein [Mucilaginibacter sp. UR6-11]|uniref:hypothetical protein n=1 Tax=Mucilaginibacter sp. UR6-11 TaxID=1435644 RepID=UPI001E49B42F|nr:hypothetical protein [Mucilaginibacter sp. UR6-11]MCC8426948.1 hypothetical protein [Mucilaginibacter sp. UR6-11]